MSKLLSIHLPDGLHEAMKTSKAEGEALGAYIQRAHRALTYFGDAPQGSGTPLEARVATLEIDVTTVITSLTRQHEARITSLEEALRRITSMATQPEGSKNGR